MNTTRALSATRVVLRRTASGLRCASEIRQTVPSAALATTPRTTALCAAAVVATTSTSTSLGRRSYGSPAYQSYTLPSSGPPPPPQAEKTEGEALPKVNETRPPHHPDQSAREAARSGIDASTTIEVEQPPTLQHFNQKNKTSSAATAEPTEATSAAQSSQQTSAQTQAPSPQPTNPSPSPATATTASPAPPAKPAPSPSKRPRPKLRARKAALKLTPAAVEQLRAILDSPEPKLIKVGVKNRGCSGLSYHLDWVEKASSFDEEVEQDGVKVLIDSKALFSIIGSEMDWVEDKLTQKFVFKNPNIKEECGCGESFMI